MGSIPSRQYDVNPNSAMTRIEIKMFIGQQRKKRNKGKDVKRKGQNEKPRTDRPTTSWL